MYIIVNTVINAVDYKISTSYELHVQEKAVTIYLRVLEIDFTILLYIVVNRKVRLDLDKVNKVFV